MAHPPRPRLEESCQGGQVRPIRGHRDGVHRQPAEQRLAGRALPLAFGGEGARLGPRRIEHHQLAGFWIEKINEPDLSKVEIRSSIKNNVITIEKTKMKISGFRFRIGGETSFDGKLNFKARLGLPPLGIVGIPMRILGTSDNPKFKYGRGSKDEDLDETEYSDEIPKDMLDKIKSAKEEDLKDEEHPN